MAGPRRYWGLDRTMMEAVKDHEIARDAILGDLKSQGVTDRQLAAAQRTVHRKGMDRAPSIENLGAQAQEGRIGNDHVVVDEAHRNAHGDLVTTVLVRNGPHMERIRVREQQVGEHTYAVTEHFGRR